ncbi:hypothetical protein L6452_34373 [Arctium lappa]|uniref:Uncharacterized protein n=1 Tax=Arctium lappa TaxID=4217 RepID=A0ACB8YHA8_ARCLA|nr:hypothetical protein L6452_34373 [Arctium lappa]
MNHDNIESFSLNEIHVKDVLENDDAFISSFVPPHNDNSFTDSDDVCHYPDDFKVARSEEVPVNGNFIYSECFNMSDDAIDEQRKAHYELEVDTRTTISRILSPSKIEAQFYAVYMRTIFLEIRKELNKVVWYCTLKCDKDGDENKVYRVKHLKSNRNSKPCIR